MASNVCARISGAVRRQYGRRVLTAGVVLMSMVCCCLDNTPTTPEDDWVPAYLYPPTEPIDEFDPAYRIISPNGGETFYIGDQCTVLVTSRGSGGSAKVNFVIGRYHLNLPPSYDVMGANLSGNDAVDTFIYTIPDSFGYVTPDLETYKVSSVTDSCVMRFENYNNPGYVDYSDYCFRIKNP